VAFKIETYVSEKFLVKLSKKNMLGGDNIKELNFVINAY